jgi:hypothetical protein
MTVRRVGLQRNVTATARVSFPHSLKRTKFHLSAAYNTNLLVCSVLYERSGLELAVGSKDTRICWTNTRVHSCRPSRKHLRSHRLRSSIVSVSHT